jgi:hypothetical protein
VATETAYGRHDYSWNLLAIHSTAYQESRGAAGPTRAADLARWSVLLRVVGQMLEADGVRDCEIEGTMTERGAPPPWRVAVRRDGQVRLRTEDVQIYVLRAEQQAAAQQANPAKRPHGAPG